MTNTRERRPTLPSLPDRGCIHHRPSCFTCPFERCRYDDERPRVSAAQIAVHTVRHERIMGLLALGVSPTNIAAQLGVSTRTVHRHKGLADGQA